MKALENKVDDFIKVYGGKIVRKDEGFKRIYVFCHDTIYIFYYDAWGKANKFLIGCSEIYMLTDCLCEIKGGKK